MFFRLSLPWQWVDSSLQLLIQLWICAPCIHYGWMDQSSVEYEVCPTLLHMVSTGKRDLVILSPTRYPLGHMLPAINIYQAIHFNPFIFIYLHSTHSFSAFQHGYSCDMEDLISRFDITSRRYRVHC